MTPADERIVQLLAKWQKSLELHARYTGLSEDQYWLVQPWPRHQRPNRWIIDLASQRLMDLQRIVQSRVAAGDPSLSEALELMSFLANLVGSQHVDRYIPMAATEQERPIASLTAGPQAVAADATTAPHRVRDPAESATVEMPRPPAEAPTPAPAKPAATKPAETRAAPRPKKRKAAVKSEDIVHDAVRLLNWGRQWHELPEAIARMAGRPSSAEVRQILRSHREQIEQQAIEGAGTH